jgi:pantoate--beta-alanine ligase
MDIITSISGTRELVFNARKQGKTIGFVPTMGALHPGHASLIDAAVKRCDYVVVSIFVNPTQFGPDEDFDKYPRDLRADSVLCETHGADLIFAPHVHEMYPERLNTWVDVENITDTLCGKFRSGHFRGVTTVCSKLFNIVMPDYAFFGQKDVQQVAVIRRMVADLNIPLEVVSCQTVRDPDGLATSSRNKYLTNEQRQDALLISRALFGCLEAVKQGTRDSEKLIVQMKNMLLSSDKVDIQYIEIVDPSDLTPIETIKESTVVAIAAFVGQTRLIDNILVDLRDL